MRTRRELVAGLMGAPALVGLERKTERPIAGGFVFEAQERGHRIRDKAGYGRAAETRRVPVVIVGGGMAGLCAAWWLERSGFRDFVLLEMEAEGAVWLAEGVIFAAPTYLAPHLIDGFAPLPTLQYSPWVVSNLTLERVPDGAGEVAWDNVIYGSPGLGYVSATHQSLRTRIDRTVWTHYWALAGGNPRELRKNLLASRWEDWRDRVMADLRRAHPRIGECVERVDIYRNGHAMCRPGVGVRGSYDLRRLREGLGGLQFAHADLSGFSIFEEAQYWGVRAARRILGRIGREEKKSDRSNQRN